MELNITRVPLPRAIDHSGAVRLLASLHRAAEDDRHAAIVLTGKDGVFCDGLDITALASSEQAPPDLATAVNACAQSIAVLRTASKPTIALIDGSVRGGGVGLAAACDVVIATERSQFALPEMLWGLLPAVIYPSLSERLTRQQCRLWALTADARTAAEARAVGLVDDVVAPDMLDRACRRWARRMSRARPATIARLRAFAAEEAGDSDSATRRHVAMTTTSLLDERLRASLRSFAENGELPWETT